MIEISSKHRTSIVLVIKLTDIETGETVIGGKDTAVISDDGLYRPVVKQDGYFVFTGNKPARIRVISRVYRDITTDVSGFEGQVMRLGLVRRITQCRLADMPDDAHVGFTGGGRGYTLAAPLGEASDTIALRKEDFADITDLCHALITPDGSAEAVCITGITGGGCYRLRERTQNAYPVRGTRLIPLFKTPGGVIPVPEDAEKLCVLSGGVLKTILPEDLQLRRDSP